MDLKLPYKAELGFDALYGLEIVAADSETIRGVVDREAFGS